MESSNRDSGRYGKIGAPEERMPAHQSADGGERILSAYRAFRGATRRFVEEYDGNFDDSYYQVLYSEACRVIRGLGNDCTGLESAPGCIPPEDGHHGYAGIFLSALLNETALEGLVIGKGLPVATWIGYRLKKGKKLVLRDGVHSTRVGRYGKGIVLNFGFVDEMGAVAEDGLYINWARATDMAEYAKGGTHINLGFAETIGIGDHSSEAVIINTGQANHVKQRSYTGADKLLLSMLKEMEDREAKLDFLESMGFETSDTLQKIFGLADDVQRHVRDNYG